MDSFLGLEVEQSEDGVKLHLDTYVTELLEEYREYHHKFLKQKKVPMQPGLVLDKEDCPEAPDSVKQKFYRIMVAKINSWAVALGSVDAPDGVPVISTQPQAQIQSRVREGAGSIR